MSCVSIKHVQLRSGTVYPFSGVLGRSVEKSFRPHRVIKLAVRWWLDGDCRKVKIIDEHRLFFVSLLYFKKRICLYGIEINFLDELWRICWTYVFEHIYFPILSSYFEVFKLVDALYWFLFRIIIKHFIFINLNLVLIPFGKLSIIMKLDKLLEDTIKVKIHPRKPLFFTRVKLFLWSSLG